jgi:hypothetical protein
VDNDYRTQLVNEQSDVTFADKFEIDLSGKSSTTIKWSYFVYSTNYTSSEQTEYLSLPNLKDTTYLFVIN